MSPFRVFNETHTQQNGFSAIDADFEMIYCITCCSVEANWVFFRFLLSNSTNVCIFKPM